MGYSSPSSPSSLFSEGSTEQECVPTPRPASRRCPPIPGFWVFPSLLPGKLAYNVLQAIGDADLFAGGVRDQVMLFESPMSEPSRSSLPSYIVSFISSIETLLMSFADYPLSSAITDMIFHQPLARQIILNMYPPGEGITPHVDLPNRYADGILGCSLAGGCVMQLTKSGNQQGEEEGPLERYEVYLPPRTVYILSGEARWDWEHGILGRMEDLVETEDGSGEQTILRDLRVSATFRLRGPRGVSTLNFDPAETTLDDLKVLIFSSTEIPPSEQEIKYGYPPKPLPESTTTLSSVPITKGEQIIVTAAHASSQAPTSESTGASARISSTSASRLATPTPAPSSKPLNGPLSAPRPLPSARSPAPSSPAVKDGVKSGESVALPGRDAGFLQLRVVPDDNSCLFSAIGVVFEGGIEAAGRLRKVVADAIKDDPFTYSEVMLGQPIEDYVRKIQQPETWGGAIELSIFSKHYKTEIASFDVATGRCDRFGQDEYDSRCLIVYSGIHYDALSLSPTEDAPPSFHTTVFPVTDTVLLTTADKLIAQLRARHYYTDTATFDLRCGVCKVGLKGEKGAREHAMKTGHVEFGEY